MNLTTACLSLPLVLLGAACTEPTTSDESTASLELGRVSTARTNPELIFASSNDAAGNSVVALTRGGDQTMTVVATFPTGGTGTGGGLGSQGAVALTANHRVLLVVNAGSNDITSFAVSMTGALTLKSRVASGGTQPVSVAVRGTLVYVLNAGGVNNVSGFHLDSSGELAALPNTTYALSAAAVGPAQVAFAPNGKTLVVTEKATNLVDTFEVLAGGVLGALESNPSAGKTPFGFAFTKDGQAIVSEASGGAAGAGTVSSYTIKRASHGVRALGLVSGPVPDLQSAPCWIAITADDQYAYATNTASGTVSGYVLGEAGELTLFDDGGMTGDAGTGSGPTDMAFDRDSRHLYVIGSKTHKLVGFEVAYDGTLSPTSDAPTLPDAAVGLVAL
jgi:6-phosphogluconolactonase